MARELRPERGDVVRFGLDRLVRGGVRGVWVRGSLPRGPVVWAANHHSWWDGFAAASVLRAAQRAPALLMDDANLGAYGFLRRAGVIPATQPRAALAALRDQRVLIVFPEGVLRPAGPLGPLRPGAQWLAEQAPATLIAVALRVVNRGHQRAEVYVDLAVVDTGVSPAEVAGSLADADRSLAGADHSLAGADHSLAGADHSLAGADHSLAGAMAAQLARLDADLLAADPREPLPGFLLTVPGRSSWDERVARWSSVLRR